MSNGLKNILRAVAFLAVCGVVLLAVQNLLVPNRDWPSGDRRIQKNISGLENEAKNSIDVLWFGTSHVYEGISPMEIYRASGIRSYVIGAPGQRVPTAYYMLKEVLKRQSPKVVALDAGGLFHTEEENQNKARWQENIDALPITSMDIRMQMAAELAKLNGDKPWDDDYIYRGLLPIMEYHTNYLLDQEEYLDMHREQVYHRKGYVAKPQAKALKDKQAEEAEALMAEDEEESGGTALSDEEIAPALALNRPYFEQMLELCRQHGAELMLFKVPVRTRQTYVAYWSREKHDLIQQMADELGVTFLDLNDEETGLDWSTDTKDGGAHLNLKGATKISAFLGNWLAGNKGLQSSADEKLKHDWDYQLELYDWEMNLFRLQMVTDINEYFEAVAQGNYTLLTCVSGSVAEFWTEELENAFDDLTGNLIYMRDAEHNAFATVSTYCNILNAGGDPSKVELSGELEGGVPYKITCEPGSSNPASIRVDGRDLSNDGYGIDFVVYDNDLHCAVDSVNFALVDGVITATRDSSAFERHFRRGVMARVYDVMAKM